MFHTLFKKFENGGVIAIFEANCSFLIKFSSTGAFKNSFKIKIYFNKFIKYFFKMLYSNIKSKEIEI